jgi:ceramide glucosyltransferase
MTWGESFLIGWSAVALLWWWIALGLLRRGPPVSSASSEGPVASITVFKPLPPVSSEEERVAMATAIESFLAELRPEDELILGMEPGTAAAWDSTFVRWRVACPDAHVQIVVRETPKQHANPKISWLRILTDAARGEVWLWSDADVTVPAGFLQEVRARLGVARSSALTAAYAVRRIENAPGVWDALYVNVEFLPGALLLGRMGRGDFAYGAAMAFRAETFRARVDWSELGAALADDHELGRRLQPVTLAPVLVSTFTRPPNWVAALQHYYRWQKTVRWCRPLAFAALAVLLPGLGWAVAAVGNGESLFLAGLFGQWSAEVLVAALACRAVGCRVPRSCWLALGLWPWVRAITWLAVWLPFPVWWGAPRQTWSAPRQR